MTKTIISIATILIFTSCNGQNNPTVDLKKQAYINSSSFSTLKKTQGSTESDNIFCMLEDKSGNIWFGTTGEGVYKYDGNAFTQITKLDGLQSNCVYSLLEDNKGVIWIGTSEGLCKFVNGKLENVSVARSTFSLNTNNSYYTNQSTKNSVWSLLQDKSGKIWVGTGDGVYSYDGKTFTRFLQNDGVINKENLKLTLIDNMLQDKAGNIWFASGVPPGEEGICVYDGKSIKSFKPNGDSWIRYIREDKKGILWFGGRSHGNFIYDGNAFKTFTEKNRIGNPVMVDKSGNIWFNGEEKQYTTESIEGIWRYDGKTFKNYNDKDGMGKYFVWSMLEDKKGNIWIGSRNTELYKYDGKSFIKFSAP
jgi:ligand-binding sensor domain-containing protein